MPPVSPHPPDQQGPKQSRPPRICALEAAGILIIGTVMLIFVLIRYGHHIAWSAR